MRPGSVFHDDICRCDYCVYLRRRARVVAGDLHRAVAKVKAANKATLEAARKRRGTQ